ncbi:hypothetical protein CR513_06867, partial [Mucuna pruriens]
MKYWGRAQKQTTLFTRFTLIYLGSTQKFWHNRLVIQETLSRPTIEGGDVCYIAHVPTWMDPIMDYLQKDMVPNDP